MKKLLILLILSFFSTQGFSASCPDGNDPTKTVSVDGTYYEYKCGLIVLNAPKAEFYQRQYDMNSEVDQILSQRKTINPFLAWNYSKAFSDKYYGIAWTGSRRYRLFSNNMLEFQESYWNYYYPAGAHGFWKDHKKQQSFIKNIDWDHAAEYGETKAMNIIHQTFPQAFADEVHSFSERGFHGVFLDWWKKSHSSTPWNTTQQERAMIHMIDEIRKQSGDDFLLIGNTNWNKYSNLVSPINGVFLELYKKPYGRTDSYTYEEIAEMEVLIKFNEKHLRYPKLIAFESYRITDKSDPYNRTSEDNLRFARLYSAMATVIPEHGYILYADNNTDSDGSDHDHHYYDVYSVDLGKPVSKYTPIAIGVAYKKFERGYIAYNRLEYDVTVNFGGFEVVIPSMDGVFLKEDGVSYQYSCEEGFILHDGICLDTGLITSHYENGEIKSMENYKDGLLDGKSTSWYQNGQIKLEVNYEDNKKTGKYTEWYQNGQIKLEVNYEDNKKTGKYTEWYQNGQIKLEENYTNGKLDGEKTISHQERQIINDEIGLIMSSFSFDEIIQQ